MRRRRYYTVQVPVVQLLLSNDRPFQDELLVIVSGERSEEIWPTGLLSQRRLDRHILLPENIFPQFPPALRRVAEHLELAFGRPEAFLCAAYMRAEDYRARERGEEAREALRDARLGIFLEEMEE